MSAPVDRVEAAPEAAQPGHDQPRPVGGWWRRWWHNRLARWLSLLVAVLLLVVGSVLLLLGTARSQQTDDPRSSTPTGTAALAQLLADEGVSVATVGSVEAAVSDSDAETTLVVANADRLSAADARRLLDAASSRLVLVRPGAPALRALQLNATTESPGTGVIAPGCANPDVARAGTIRVSDMRAGYGAVAGAELACYPTGAGFALLRVQADGALVDLVAGGLANNQLADQGNASLATSVLGSQPRVVWLMVPRPDRAGPGENGPGLLPTWWEMAVVQAFVALLVLAVWRGRRLGPILSETLPVRVRAAETVEGHGRLYYRLGAKDRAAEALRSAARTRLARSFGHLGDPGQLSAVLATRTGRDVRSVHELLYGPAPDTDDHLRDLAVGLDQLEQEARRL